MSCQASLTPPSEQKETLSSEVNLISDIIDPTNMTQNGEFIFLKPLLINLKIIWGRIDSNKFTKNKSHVCFQ